MHDGYSLMTALFPDRESAELGFWALCARGYARNDIGVLMSDYAKQRYFRSGGTNMATDTGLGAKALEGAIAGPAASHVWEVPQERLRRYDEGMRRGGIVMIVQPRNQADARYFDNEWRINRAQDVYC